ncbi:MAG TPA: inositol monophosphatase [Candidatus Didemnitutus sp.]|nr:inositol monophosphatase [Candidatus Didemnitutus sp.]
MKPSARELEATRRLLCGLQDAVRDRVIAVRRLGMPRLARVQTVTVADTIYALDVAIEKTVLAWFARHWPVDRPVELVMEGLEGRGPVTFPRGTPVTSTHWKCIIDPIDGTRGLMYDKRSGWCLAGLAPQRGQKTNLADIVVAAMTELPTSKGGFADQLSAVRGKGVTAERVDLRTGRRQTFRPQPSRATTVGHGFASFAKFFPDGKSWLSAREEQLWAELAAGSDVFDDQYMSTGGQLYEIIAGHDRFIADLRPLANERLGIRTSRVCHPYDIATALIAQEAGCVVTDAEGASLRAPLDTTSPVSWVAYANRALARKIGPVLRQVMAL